MSNPRMPFLTKIAKASSKSESLRTTIPKEIVERFNLEMYDLLIWEIVENRLVIKKWDGKYE